MGKTEWALAWVAGVTFGAGMTQAAAPAERYSDQIRDCGALATRSARYACYDAANRTERQPERVPRPGPARVAPAESFGEDSMAAEKRPRPEHAPVAQVFATAISAKDDGGGYWTITLDSGVRWRMTERVHQFVPPKPGQPVRVRRVALGSFLLFVGQQPGVRVQRIS